jgi:ACT domain-containing protein
MKEVNVPSPPLFTLSIEEFIGLQKTLLKEELLKMTSSFKSGSSSSTYYNYKEALAFLKVSKPTFSKIRNAGLIKSYRVSEKRVLFAEADLQQYLSDRKEH